MKSIIGHLRGDFFGAITAGIVALPIIEEGATANFIILGVPTGIDNIKTVAQPLAGFKNGRQTFSNTKAKICF
ncbi:MAG: hypothetical protein WA913_16100 [Pricia sp.]